MLHPDFAKFSWDSQQGREVAMSENNKKKIDGANPIFHYEESLVSSNLNSKLFWFHSVIPNLNTVINTLLTFEKFATSTIKYMVLHDNLSG